MHLREQVTQPSDPSYRLIPLTRGQIAIVDTADFDWLMQWRWHAQYAKNNNSFYAARTVNLGQKKFKMIAMARLIMNAPPKSFVDHRDRNTLNNRRQNLRIATPAQNNANRIMQKSSSNRFKGVVPKPPRRWQASISISGKRISLGCFDAEEEAHLAYKAEAIRVYGEFARW